MLKVFVGLFISILFSGCDSLDSSFGYDKAPPKPIINEKPQKCLIDFSKTCWSQTIQEVSKCLQQDKDGDFSDDKKICTNGQGSTILFMEDPVAMFARPYDVFQSPIGFRILSDSKKECMRVTGTRNEFEIFVARTGQKIQWSSDDQGIQFNCLDGQKVSVNHEDYAGCSQKLGNDFLQTVPGLELEPILQKTSLVGWTFSFRGAPDLDPVFNCYMD